MLIFVYVFVALKSGCADKSREGFFNEPNVAGCQGEWDGLKSLRDVPTGKCGNKFPDGRTVKCREPADLCDVDNGWRICGSNGNPADIRNYVNSLFEFTLFSSGNDWLFRLAARHVAKPLTVASARESITAVEAAATRRHLKTTDALTSTPNATNRFAAD